MLMFSEYRKAYCIKQAEYSVKYTLSLVEGRSGDLCTFVGSICFDSMTVRLTSASE